MKKLLLSLVVLLIMTTGALAYGEEFSLRSTDSDVKLNLWSKEDMQDNTEEDGKGTAKKVIGDIEYRYKLNQLARYGNVMVYEARVTSRNLETRDVAREELIVLGFWHYEYINFRSYGGTVPDIGKVNVRNIK